MFGRFTGKGGSRLSLGHMCCFDLVKRNHVLSCNIIKEVQQRLQHGNAGFRSLPGKKLKRSDWVVVYTPPQNGDEVEMEVSN